MQSQTIGQLRPFLGLILLLFVAWASAQELNITVFNRSNGLACNYINDIVRDSEGYFWVGTDAGILRFDGVNFTPVPVRLGKQGDVLRLRLFRNDLYIIYRNLRAVDHLDVSDLSWKEVMTGDISDITLIDKSTLVAFDRSGKLMRYKNGRKDIEQKVVSAFDGVMTYWRGRVFLQAFGKDLFCYDPNDLRMVHSYGLDPNSILRGGFQPLPDRLIVNFTSSIHVVDSDFRLKPFTPVPASQFTISHGLGYYSERLQYFLRADRELVIARDGRFRGITFPGRRIPELRSLLMVDSANVLIGTNGSLIHYRDHAPPVNNFNRDDSLFRNQIRVRRNIIPIRRDLIVLTGSPGIVRWESDRVSAVPYPGMLYSSDAVRIGQRLYGVGENKSVMTYDFNSGRLRTQTYLSPAEEQGFYSITADTASGELILGGRGALFRIAQEGENIQLVTAVKEGTVMQIRRSPDGFWWVCTMNGLIRFDTNFKRRQHFSSDSGVVRIRGKYINDILVESPERFWVAHENGAEQVDLNRRLVMDSIPLNLLPDSRVACIRKDTLGRLWFSTFNGILAYDPQSGGHIRLGENSGLINKEFNRRSGAFLPDARLIFGGDGGYDIINPYAFRFQRSRAVGRITAVEWFEYSGKVRQAVNSTWDDVITFNTEAESVRIYLSTLDGLEASTCRFQFRLNNGLWQDLDGKFHVEIFSLATGDYIFELRGFDRYGTLITFKPFTLRAWLPFYKRLSFIVVLLSALLVLLVIIIFIIRNNQLKEQRLLEGISMDLHDEVGSVLTRALMVARTPDFPRRDERVQDFLSDALFSLRAYIRTINRNPISVERFLADLRDLVQLNLDNSGVSFRFSQEGDLAGDIPATVSRDIKLSMFEMLNNVLKHSGATHVDIAITLREGVFRLTFSDNGKLASIDQLGRRGNGLANLEKRVARHRGVMERRIREEGNGLHLTLKYKI